MKKLLVLVIILGLLYGAYITIIPGYNLYIETLKNDPLDKKIEALREEPHYTKYSDIPKMYFNALVATEDRRYYVHNGLDLIGSGRAVYVNLKGKKLKEGGSTISQQLAKNLYFPLDYTVKRKVAEILMALKIERDYSKEEVLEIYVNCIYYGSGYTGIYEASKGYFNKKPKDLNLNECTILVGVPNAPSKYSPKVNMDLCLQRQAKVLREMVKGGYITEKERSDISKKK